MTTRADLQQALNRLEAVLPQLLHEAAEPAAFWSAFAGHTAPVIEAAGPDHHAWVVDKIDGMLSFQGIFAYR